MAEGRYPRIVFPDGFDNRAEEEMPLRACLIDASVELEDGTRYAVEFVDPVRLRQDLEENLKLRFHVMRNRALSWFQR